VEVPDLRLLWFVAPLVVLVLVWAAIGLWRFFFPVDDEEIDMPHS
jgi:hypothetical protein